MGYTSLRKNLIPLLKKFGRGILKFMLGFLYILSYVGTAAMQCVGAEIIAHGVPFTSHLLHDLEYALNENPAVAWFAKALACAVAGLFVGFVVENMVSLLKKVLLRKRIPNSLK